MIRDAMNRARLAELINNRDTGAPSGESALSWIETQSYWQGRIDEFCSQNAIGSDDLAALLIRLGKRPEAVATPSGALAPWENPLDAS